MNQAEFKRLAQSHSRIALFRELSADHLTPIQAFVAVSGHSLLESGSESIGKHSYIGTDPILTLSDPEAGFEALRSFPCHADHPLALYTGGFVGYAAYDAVRLIEEIPDRHLEQKSLPDLYFNLYRTSVIFDHQSGSLILGQIVEVGSDPEADYVRGCQELESLEEKLMTPIALAPLKQEEIADVLSEINDSEFSRMVEKAKESVSAGELFQLVASRTFKMPYSDGFALYRRLRKESRAPYLFYFDLGDVQIAGASPEKLISVKDGIVESTPIAGTRPADADPEELLSDPKEVAEHQMLVDLARNDLGAISEIGTVEVKELMKVHRFPKVLHIVSKVTGKLRQGLDAIDAFKASFPAGTLTGAPKIRAMERIDELETSRRGLYGGAIIAIDAKGNLDSCIAIRMGIVERGELSVRAGAGIVFDSDPASEAQETKLKAASVLHVAGGVQ